MTDREVDFTTTMLGLEAGLRVEHIASFSMSSCSPEESLIEVVGRMSEKRFDQFPVRDGDRIVGVLDRPTEADGKRVSDAMLSLAESMLISASDSLGTLMPLLEPSPYRLVVRQGRIQGIVTRSDLIKLPVRLFAFAKVSHLELLMGDHIRTAMPDQADWMILLTNARQQSVQKKMEAAMEKGRDPDPIEMTDFCDKRDIVKKRFRLGNGFEGDLKQVEDLRNTLAHSGDYGEIKALEAFLVRLKLAEKWVSELGKMAISGSSKIESSIFQANQTVS